MAQEPKYDFDFMPSPVGERLPSPNDEIIQFALESDNHNLQALANDFVQYVQTIEQNDEEAKSQILQVETFTMMAKYQLFYIKMENFWKKFQRIFNKRALDHKHYVFKKLFKKGASKVQKEIVVAGKVKIALAIITGYVSIERAKKLGYSFSAIKSRSILCSNLDQQTNELFDLRSKVLDRERSLQRLKKEIGSSNSALLFTGAAAVLKKKNSRDKITIAKKKDSADECKQAKDTLKALQDSSDLLEVKLRATEKQIFKFITELAAQITKAHIEPPASQPLTSLNDSSRQKFKLFSKLS